MVWLVDFSKLTLEVQLPAFSVSYWVSHSKMIGFKLAAHSIVMRSRLKQALSDRTDGLIHRPDPTWSVEKYRSELRKCVIHLCSNEPPEILQRSNSRTTIVSTNSAARNNQDGLASVDEQSEDEEADTQSIGAVSITSDTNTILSAKVDRVRETELISIERVTYNRTDDRILDMLHENSDAKVLSIVHVFIFFRPIPANERKH